VVVSYRADRFDAVYREHYRAIYAYVYRRMPGRAAEVPDVVAEVFVVAWRRFEELPHGAEARLWLYSVAHRCVLVARRGARRRLKLMGRLDSEARTRPGTAQTNSQMIDVRTAIDRLRPKDQEVLLLVMWEGLSHAEAATVLKCSVNAVAQRLHAARERLQAQLTDTVPDAAAVIVRK
jgi:RNA polymerase sigma-70 factor, ECF subfamily